MNKLNMESLSEIRGGSNAGYRIGEAIGSFINWLINDYSGPVPRGQVY